VPTNVAPSGSKTRPLPNALEPWLAVTYKARFPGSASFRCFYANIQLKRCQPERRGMKISGQGDLRAVSRKDEKM